MPTEIEQYYSLGYRNGKVQYVFVNPFRTEATEDEDAFKDHIRDIPVVMDADGIDEDATMTRIGEVARGVFNKMKIAAEAYVPEGSEDDAIALFGELPESEPEADPAGEEEEV